MYQIRSKITILAQRRKQYATRFRKHSARGAAAIVRGHRRRTPGRAIQRHDRRGATPAIQAAVPAGRGAGSAPRRPSSSRGPPPSAILLLKFVKELGDQVRLQIGDDQEQYANVFEAVMAAFPTAMGAEQQTAAKQAAIEAAALFLAENAWPAAANTITDGLTEIGMQNVAALEIFNTIRNVAGIVIDPNKAGPRRPRLAFPRLLAVGDADACRRTGPALLPRRVLCLERADLAARGRQGVEGEGHTAYPAGVPHRDHRDADQQRDRST